jgi:uncharacterized protein YbjT (DUF2867 family)
VAGATGRLGAVVPELLAHEHDVIALSRDPDARAAIQLRELGATVVWADFDEPASIAEAAAGADALIATGTAHRAGPDGELRHGLGLADAAETAGVRHLIYISGDGAAPDSPLPLFRAKHAVEERIRSSRTPHTILAPTYFMENLFNPWNLQALRAGVLPSPVPPQTPLQQAAFADVLSLAALAVESPERFKNARITVASDELTATQAAAAIDEATGIALQPQQTPADGLPPGLRALFGWLASQPHGADITGLRTSYPEVSWHSYRQWARAERDRLETATGAPPVTE